ncbi:MAG: tail fiber repeat family protein [Caudoviricetes sp.]|nr:MAG: tail fiber repeat family protein [Caudoviricetes sp.]
MSIENITGLSTRIGVATDKLEDAVIKVQNASGAVVGGSGEAAKSAFAAAQSALEAKSTLDLTRLEYTKVESQVYLAKQEVTKAISQATIASTQASESANSALAASISASSSETSNLSAKAQVGLATEQAVLARKAAQEAIDAAPVIPEGVVVEAPKDNRLYGRIDGAWALVPTGGSSSGGSGTGSVDTVNGIAPDSSGNVQLPIPQPVPQVVTDWNAVTGLGRILNKPTLFDGDYRKLTNKPTIFNGSFSALTGVPALFDGNYNSLINKPKIFSGNYSDLVGAPVIPTPFSGNYNDLTNKPDLSGIGTGGGGVGGGIVDAPVDGKWYARKDGLWKEVEAGVAFSGDYRDLTNKPALNTDGTVGGGAFNGDYNDLVNKPPLITSNSQLFNGAKYLVDAPQNNKNYYRRNGEWFSSDDVGSGLGHKLDKHAAWQSEGDPTDVYGLFVDYENRKFKRFTHWLNENPNVTVSIDRLSFRGADKVMYYGMDILYSGNLNVLPTGRYAFKLYTGSSNKQLYSKFGYLEIVRVKRTSAYDGVTETPDGEFDVISLNSYLTATAYTLSGDYQIEGMYTFSNEAKEFFLFFDTEGVVEEAPKNINQYVRYNGQWVDAQIPRKTGSLINDADFVPDVPKDGKQYVRSASGWNELKYVAPNGAFPVDPKAKLYYKTQLMNGWGSLNANTPVDVRFLEAILGGKTSPRASKGEVFTAEGVALLPNGRYYFNKGDFKSTTPFSNKSGYIEKVAIPTGSATADKDIVTGYTIDPTSSQPVAIHTFNRTTEKWDEVWVKEGAKKIVNSRTGTSFEEWVGTQAQYDAITTKDPNTRYWITEE